MFDLSLLDTAIGLVFIYSLLSLVCAAVSELFAALLRSRARNLQEGIRFLLGEEPPPWRERLKYWAGDTWAGRMFDCCREKDTLTAKFYDHPIIKALRADGQKPPYIPSCSFALTLIDLVRSVEPKAAPTPPSEGAVAGASGATLAPPSTGSGTPATAMSHPPGGQANPLGGGPPFAPPPPISPLSMGSAAAGAPPASPNKLLQEIQNNILPLRAETPAGLLRTNLKRSLYILIEDAGGDFNKARTNIEAWFNYSMDNVSGWYKRKSQYFLLGVALLTTLAANVDTIYIVKTLMKNKDARQALVAAAPALAESQQTPTPSPTPTSTPHVPKVLAIQPGAGGNPTRPNTGTGGGSTGAGTAGDTGGSTQAKDGAPADQTPPAPAREIKNIPDTLEELKTLDLPLGWESGAKDISRRFPGYPPPFGPSENLAAWGEQVKLHWLGWLITTFALSLGAPFWFDILNKFIVIRSTVKPREKSLQQQSKDRLNPDTEVEEQQSNKS